MSKWLNSTIFTFYILDLNRVINHPVHVVSEDNQTSTSAFIPFCDFGGNMSAVGVKIDQFDVHVCNSFQATNLNDQLCYEVDLNAYSDEDNIENELKLGFSFLMDYNEDRHVSFEQKAKKMLHDHGLTRSVEGSDQSQHASIYLNTIGGGLMF